MSEQISEMALDGCLMVNMDRHAEVALAAAKAAAAQQLDQYGGDLSKWSAEQYHHFVWNIVAAGVWAAANKTLDDYSRVIAGLDSIPYR